MILEPLQYSDMRQAQWRWKGQFRGSSKPFDSKAL